eukprot:TRINITY_DN30006_c0_g1_i1.p1 TRINITY_DN30006_c0_g1~~TRINITY_DN30006_c0_g1_i1.p1  ORF type:complete len:285 (+),score=122.24 TRINITY_DN30006_c0_g1_i1:45-899(+)
MVDYSKFDALAREVDAEEANAGRRAMPSVTKLDGKTTVTVGKHGALSFTKDGEGAPVAARGGVDYSKWDKLDVSDDEEEYDEDGGGEMDMEGVEASPTPPVPAAAPSVIPPQASQAAPTSPGARLTKNGGRNGDAMYWTQTPDEVTVHFAAAQGTRARDVKVRLTKTRLTCEVKQGDAAGGDLAFPIKLSDDEDETDLDWEVLDHPVEAGQRLVRVTLRKDAPGNTVAWWTRVFKGDEEIPLDSIADRKGAKAAEAQKVWDEAHRIFKERVASGQLKRMPPPSL